MEQKNVQLSMPCKKARIKYELKNAEESRKEKQPLTVMQISSVGLNYWTAILLGNNGGEFEGGIYFMNLETQQDYPFKPSHARFLTKTHQPNVMASG